MPADGESLVFQTNDGHNYASNQFLGGLAAPQGNLGGDGLGNFTGSLNFDLNNFSGDQFFVLSQGPVAPGTNYCTSTANSSGSAAVMSATGSNSIAANDLTISATTVPDEFGLFYFGPNQLSMPFGNGTRCVGGSTVRLNPPSLSSGGTASRVVDVIAEGIVPGDVNFQYWFRDPSAGGSAYDLSDGYQITFVP